MARLIDADKFLSSMIKRFKCVPLIGRNDYDCESLKQMLIEAPTVDAVEVVRCKDCKHCVWDEEEQLWECVVEADVDGDADTYALFHEYNEAEHFCSYGERRTDD